MSGFQPVNTTLTVPASHATQAGETTPDTPRPGQMFSRERRGDNHIDESTVKTPTRDSFGGVAGQRPLPSDEMPSPQKANQPAASNMAAAKLGSKRASRVLDPADVDMGDDNVAQDMSDGESVQSESNGRPSKKKKGQRFFCTDFPPCNLSFTRSEHLARHIRKHTGERPFQCHCSRRFSRLDNLRQHAQTVHVNEDIPDGSLAATGTRFQRQIRTERMGNPNGGRARSSTLSSLGGHSRGHSRNLSTSSITSTGSTMSQMSTIDDSRRRPPPPIVAMANENGARARLSLDTFGGNLMGGPGPTVQSQPYGSHSPGDSTPTSATYSGTGSPRFSSGFQSPVGAASRLAWGTKTPGRRLSVPSGANPFQASPAQGQMAFISPLPSAASPAYSGSPSMYGSPTSSVFSESRRDSAAHDAEWKRRTWHPGTYTGLGPRPATSGLTYYQTPDAPRPLFSGQPAASQTQSSTTRLPGIESFDHAPPPPALARRQATPMQVDQPSQQPPPPPAAAAPLEPPSSRPGETHHRRGHSSWDVSNRFNRLDITSPQASGRDAGNGWVEYRYPQTTPQAPAARPTTAPHVSYSVQAAQSAGSTHQEPDTRMADQPTTPNRSKRQGWYHGPASAYRPSHSQHSSQSSILTQRTSPDGSSSSDGVPTPSTTSLGEYQPAIVHSNGYIEPHQPAAAADEQQKVAALQSLHQQRHSYHQHPQPSALGPPFNYGSHHEQSGGPVGTGLGISAAREESRSEMSRLDALVAVATGEQAGNGRQ